MLLWKPSSPSPGHGAHHLSYQLGSQEEGEGCCGQASCSGAPREPQPPALPRVVLAASSTPINSQSSSHNWPSFSHPHKCPKHLHFKLKFPMFNLRPKGNVCGESLSKFPSSICNLSAKKGENQLFFSSKNSLTTLL